MKAYNSIGSKERFLEMFQRVNKVQLNEDVVQGNAGTNVFEIAFNDLKNNTFNIKHTNSQTTGDENFIEINGIDKSGNDITFRFRVTVNQGEQEGVIGIESAELINFIYKSRTHEMEVPEGMRMLTQFNANHASEIADVVGEYADFDTESSQAMDELYEEAIKLIDKVPYNKSTEEMQTQKAYFDQKPTNPNVRVNAPELQKFVKEEELDPFALPPDYSGGDFKDTEDIEEPVSDEPEEEATPEETQLLDQAFNNLLTRNKSRGNLNYYPTRPELEREMQRLRPQEPPKQEPGVHMAQGKKRVYPAWADKYLAEQYPLDATNVIAGSYEKLSPEKRSEIIRKAVEFVDNKLGVKKFQMSKEHYFEIVKQFALQIYHHGLHTDDTHMFGVKDMNETDYPEEMGIAKEIKTSTSYPKPKKKHRIKKLKVKTGMSESTDQDKYEDVVFLQGDEAFQPLDILNNKGKDAALEYLKQWHYPGEHQGSQELGHGTDDQTYEKDGYIMSWNSRIGYIGLQYDLSNLNEEDETDDGMSLEPQGDEIAQLAQDKEEAGEMLQGGKGDDKSPLEFDPDQIIMGMEVEKEHTDDPMAAIEIVLDHLTENPEYYTAKDTPETSAQAGASADANKHPLADILNTDNNDSDLSKLNMGRKGINRADVDDKEKTDVLLGYKSKNVGDSVDESNESTIKQNNPAEWHRIQIAKKTLKMPDAMVGVMGGMTKEEAKQILNKYNIKLEEEFVGASNATSAVGTDNEEPDEISKYQEYKTKDINTLNDTQKKEYFDLWTKYEPKKTQ